MGRRSLLREEAEVEARTLRETPAGVTAGGWRWPDVAAIAHRIGGTGWERGRSDLLGVADRRAGQSERDVRFALVAAVRYSHSQGSWWRPVARRNRCSWMGGTSRCIRHVSGVHLYWEADSALGRKSDGVMIV